MSQSRYGEIMSQGGCLKYMEEYKKATIKELSEFLGISTATIGKNMLRLEEQGLVKRGREKRGINWIKKWTLVEVQ